MNQQERNNQIKKLELTITTLQELLQSLKNEQKIEKTVDNKIDLHHQTKPNTTVDNLQIKVEKQLNKGNEKIKRNRKQSTQLKNEKVKRNRKPFDVIHFGQTWLPRIFVAIMLLGIVWLFKAGIDAGILTSTVRIAIGIVLSFILYFTGTIQIKANRPQLGLVLLAGSITSLVVTTFAAHFQFEYISTTVAFILNIVWVSLGIFLAHQYKSQSLAIFISSGAFILPFLLYGITNSVFLFISYELILTAFVLLYAFRQRYKTLYITSYIMSQFIIIFYDLISDREGLIVSLIVFYVLIQTLLYYHFRMVSPFVYKQRIAIFLVNGFLLFEQISSLNTYEQIWLLGLSIIYALITAYELREDKKSILAIATFGLSMLSLTIFIANQFDGTTQSIAFIIQGCIGFIVAFRVKNYVKAVISGIVYVCGAEIVLLSTVIEVLSLELFAHIVLLTSIVVALVLYGKKFLQFNKVLYQLIYYAFMIVLFITITKAGQVVSNDSDINHLVVSFLWMLYASVFIWYGRRSSSQLIFAKQELLIIGLLTIFITIGKLFVFDLPFVSLTIRAFLFLVIGIIGVFISRLFFNKK